MSTASDHNRPGPRQPDQRPETILELEDLIDLDFESFCAREGDDSVSLQEVREATSKIPGSMAEAISEDERAERY
jgi:hypothetical protein